MVIGAVLIAGPIAVHGAENVITIGVSTGYPPYYYMQDGQLVGICIDLADRVADSLGLRISYRHYPWKRLLLNAQRGTVDAIMPLFRTKEREAYLYFEGLALVAEENRFFTWKQAPIVYDGAFEPLQPFTIGVVAGYSYGRRFDAFTGLTTVTTKNDHHLVKMFKHKRFDIGIGNKDVVMFNARQEQIADRIQFLDPAVTKSSLYIGFSEAAAAERLAERFAVALDQLKATPAYRSILEKYGLIID